jgi:hypothetical protein
MFDPERMPNSNGVAATLQGVLESCDSTIFEESINVHQVHDFKTASKIAAELNVPVIFREFKQDHASVWEKLYAEHENDNLSQAKIEEMSFGNMFMAGTRTYIHNIRNVTVRQILDPANTDSYYASFASFLTLENVADVLGTIPPTYHLDTNFISNFKRDVTASPIHSTTYVTSYSLQLVGQKIWVWAPPADMERIGAISAHTANYHYKGSEADYFKSRQVFQFGFSMLSKLLICYVICFCWTDCKDFSSARR